MIVKLPVIILQACKFTKNELLHTHFSRILARFKLLFIVLFLGIMSWKDASRFNGGRGLFLRWGASFLSGGCAPWAGIGFDGGGVQKNWRGPPPPPSPPCLSHYGKPCIKGSCGFIERSSTLYVITLPGLTAICLVAVEIKCF